MYNIFGIATDTKLKNEKGKLVTPSELLSGWAEVNFMIELDVTLHYINNVHHIVSVLHQNEGGIGKSIPDAQEISRDPRDFPRAKPEGNLEGRSIHLQGWIRKSIPVGREGLTVLKSIVFCRG